MSCALVATCSTGYAQVSCAARHCTLVTGHGVNKPLLPGDDGSSFLFSFPGLNLILGVFDHLNDAWGEDRGFNGHIPKLLCVLNAEVAAWEKTNAPSC